MVNKQTKNYVSKTQLILIIAAISILIFALMAALIAAFLPKEMSPKDEIIENINNFTPGKKEADYTAKYLEDFGIHGFDTGKFKICENFFKTYSIYERSTADLAVKTANLFISNHYDEINLDDKTALTDALIACYVEAYGDGYAVYRTRTVFDDYQQNMSGSFAGIGITVTYNADLNEITVIKVIEGSGAEEAGILVGDKLIGAAGKTLEEVGYDALISLIRGKVGEPVEIKVLRNGELMTFTPVRKQIVEKSVTYSMTADKIGYIEIKRFLDNTDEQFALAVDALISEGAVGIIFDLRDNPGGYLDSVVNAIDYLVPNGKRIASHAKSGNETVYFAKDGHEVNLPMAVVFNGNTASAAELFSAALRDYDDMGIIKSVSCGTRTFGKGIMQSTFTLEDGSALTLTTSFYNPPCDVNYDGVGIEPDFEINLTGTGDEQLQRL